MEPALFHSVPDFQGDSLELSRRAAETDKSVIVFCGVRFMAETAKILNPTKTVLLPTEKGGCSLAASITAADVRALRAAYPGVPIVTYINTYADVKAECDICCTSSNAVAVVESLNSDTVIFLPDEYLARNVARETGRHVIVPSVLPKAGARAEHRRRAGDDRAGRAAARCTSCSRPRTSTRCASSFPDVMILAHPECSPEVVEKADFSGSTTAMIAAVEKSNAKRFLLLTECSMGDNIVAANPRQGDAAALQPPLPAHERDHAREYARLAQVHALGDRRAGGHPRARTAVGRAHAGRRPEDRLKRSASRATSSILGCGIAGGTAALELADAGLDVVIVTRAEQAEESNTYWAQGGIIYTADGDSPELLAQDICRRRRGDLPRAGGGDPGAQRAAAGEVAADRQAEGAVRPRAGRQPRRSAARAAIHWRASCTRRTSTGARDRERADGRTASAIRACGS